MKVYLVGGAVRDKLLRDAGVDVAPGDRDWVVVGATPEAMVQQGFRPVGSDFPVFLHPVTHEEYALARTERKTAHGYHGFAFHATPDVTLQEDLGRRDLTINAMALDGDILVDPFHGEADLKARVLRHVGPAFVEDPVRILRLARFAARFPDFTVAQETQTLLAQMVASGEADHLVAERLTAELSRGLMEKAPARMLEVLAGCGFWERVLPEAPITPRISEALTRAVALDVPLAARTAILFSELAPELCHTFTRRLRLTSDATDVLSLLLTLKTPLLAATTPEDMLCILERLDFLRRPKRLEYFLATMTCLLPDVSLQRFRDCAERFRSVNTSEIAQRCSASEAIPLAIRQERLRALEGAFR